MRFQQRQGETFCEAWTRFKDLLRKIPFHGIDLWLQIQIFYYHIHPSVKQTIDQAAGGRLFNKSPEEAWKLIEDLALYDNESWEDPRDLPQIVKAISLPSSSSSTSDRRISELEDQVEHLMKSGESPKPSNQECVRSPTHASVDYVSSQPKEAGNRWATPKQGPLSFDEAYEAWKDKPGFSWIQARSVSFGDPESFNQSQHSPTRYQEEALGNFMTSQEANLSKLEAQFRQRQMEMNNKIDDLIKVAHALVAAAPVEEVKSISATPPSSQTYPPLRSSIQASSSNIFHLVTRQRRVIRHPAMSILSILSLFRLSPTKPTTVSQTKKEGPTMGK